MSEARLLAIDAATYRGTVAIVDGSAEYPTWEVAGISRSMIFSNRVFDMSVTFQRESKANW